MATAETTTTYSPAEFAERMRRDMERNMLRVRNGIRLATGVGKPKLGVTPKDTVFSYDKMQLWRYRSDQRRVGPPVLMVMSLVSRSYIFDLRPGNSLVEFMLARGFDVYVLDWGVPDHLDAENTVSTYTDDYLPTRRRRRVPDQRQRRPDDGRLLPRRCARAAAHRGAPGHARSATWSPWRRPSTRARWAR